LKLISEWAWFKVLEQILGILLRLIKEFKLQHQHEYDGMRKEWLCKRCQTMSTKLRVLEHLLLRDTYTQESLPALQKIRGYVMEANEEATAAYNRAVTRLREYQGVDQYFDDIARRYHDLVMKLEGIQWTIQQVEMDLESAHEHTSR
jgi:HAUS augmin-like complex subunit 4